LLHSWQQLHGDCAATGITYPKPAHSLANKFVRCLDALLLLDSPDQLPHSQA